MLAEQSTVDPTGLTHGGADPRTRLLACIVDSSDDAIISKNLEGVITSWNKAAERIFGYTALEATGRDISIIEFPKIEDESVDILNQIRQGHRIDHYQTVRRRKDGVPIDIWLTASPIRDESQRIIGVSMVARDITEVKRAEVDCARSPRNFRTQCRPDPKQSRTRRLRLHRVARYERAPAWDSQLRDVFDRRLRGAN